MASPYLVFLKIQYPSGTNLNNINVTLRVESTNESKTKTTNSSGEVDFNLGSSQDFPSGYAVGDVFSYSVSYQAVQAFGSHTIAVEGGFTKTVVLTAVPTAPSLRYYTAQDFLDYFDLKIYEDDRENGVKLRKLALTGSSVETSIDNDAGSKFDTGNSFTEYIDTDKYEDIYLITNIPVQTLTTIATTQNDEETSPDYTNQTTEWDTLTEGTDYFLDKDTGKIQVVGTKKPISRRNGIYIAGTKGRSSVPADIRELAIIETGMRMMGASFVKARIKDKNEARIGDSIYQDSFNAFRRRVIGKYQSTAPLIT